MQSKEELWIRDVIGDPEFEIGGWTHCKKCLEELPDGVTPAEWARNTSAVTNRGILIWCNRHEEAIALIGDPESMYIEINEEAVVCSSCEGNSNDHTTH